MRLRGRRRTYLVVLGWSFTLFNSARIIAYLPTMWAIHVSGDAGQHSLWTWLIWFGSHLTMAAWLHEQGGQRLGRASMVSLCNALMCAAIAMLVGWYRWWGADIGAT
ncbi:MAG: hypothetical protein ACK515_05520 [bacterium]|jgi:hypothetical protein|nr:hypothetical protein [Betaproteobacteria bacterium]